jgi:hypothetical protein
MVSDAIFLLMKTVSNSRGTRRLGFLGGVWNGEYGNY